MQSIRRLLPLARGPRLALSTTLSVSSSTSRFYTGHSAPREQHPQRHSQQQQQQQQHHHRSRSSSDRRYGQDSGGQRGNGHGSRWEHQPSRSPQPEEQAQHQGSSRSGHPAPDPSSLPSYTGTPLPQLQQLMNRKAYSVVDAFVDANFDPERQSLLHFCGNACDARDVVLCLMRVYVALGRMEKVRKIFLAALRDLGAAAVVAQSGNHNVDDDDGAADSLTAPTPPTGPSLSLLNVNVFNGYLEALTRRRNYDKDEVIFILDCMREHQIEANALTYHYLLELHILAGYHPLPLWNEAFHEKKLRPLPATVQMMLLRVVPHTSDGAFVIEVVREALACDAAVMDKRTLAELIEQGLTESPSGGGVSSSRSAGGAGDASASSPPPVSAATRYPPEVIMWLMLELEVRCLLDKTSFVQYIQKQHVAELLLRCAKSADATTAAEVLALMDRHVMAKTADVLSLVVWCWAQAGELVKAFDMLELMARKGYLELTDPMKKYHVESLRYTMDRNFLMVLADAVASAPGQLDKILAHLRQRRADKLVVSIHSLDVVVLAAAKLGEEGLALHTALSYGSEWGVQPRTATLNCLLVGCSTGTGGSNSANGSFMLLGNIYESMLRAGVPPDHLTFRILIRQSVLGDCIDDAVGYLEEVTKHPGLRVEAEMILPIMERAARVGDVETVNRVSKFSLDCDVGIDGAVLKNIMKHLAEAGQSVEVLQGQQPLHEALRSRSKVGRQRARSELIL